MRTIFILLFCIYNKPTVAQNLIANYSFEDANLCTELTKPCCPAAWFFVQNNANGYNVYNNTPSATGYRNLRIEIANKAKEKRQYWQTKLLCPIKINAKYSASITISSSDEFPNKKDIGFYFTNEAIYLPNDTVLTPSSFISFDSCIIKKLKNEWVQLTTTFTTQENFKYLTIGNFSKETNKEIYKKRKIRNQQITLIIDDVIITPENEIICNDYAQNKDTLYANKNRHTFEIKKDTSTFKKQGIDTIFINNLQYKSSELLDNSILNKFEALFTKNEVKEIQVITYSNVTNPKTTLPFTLIKKLILAKYGQNYMTKIKEIIKIRKDNNNNLKKSAVIYIIH